MLKFDVKTVPHLKQRYETVGDWYIDVNGTHFIVSEMGDWRMELAVVVHEIVEWALCRYAGVLQEDVDDFDVNYERNRAAGDTSEPGDDPTAPYHKQHCVATGIERIVIACLGVSWRKYENKINSLQRG